MQAGCSPSGRSIVTFKGMVSVNQAFVQPDLKLKCFRYLLFDILATIRGVLGLTDAGITHIIHILFQGCACVDGICARSNRCTVFKAQSSAVYNLNDLRTSAGTASEFEYEISRRETHIPRSHETHHRPP